MTIMEKKSYTAPMATRGRMMTERLMNTGSGTDQGDVGVSQGEGGQGSTEPARSKHATFSVWDDDD